MIFMFFFFFLLITATQIVIDSVMKSSRMKLKHALHHVIYLVPFEIIIDTVLMNI